MKTQRFMLTILLLAVPLTACASLVQAQTDGDRAVAQVRRQLNLIKVTAEDKGLEQTHNFKIDKLNANRADSFKLTLNKGRHYILLSVCDNDCSDLDIKVYDENDNQVGVDNAGDDLPMVRVTPRWTGPFTIRVEMAECSHNPCYYGIGVFAEASSGRVQPAGAGFVPTGPAHQVRLALNVRAENGQPLAGATLSLLRPEAQTQEPRPEDFILYGHTDRLGRYISSRRIAPGSYQLVVSCPGYGSYRNPVTIYANNNRVDEAAVNVTLYRAA